jgi:DNA-binding NarL/FixJ family response regulator
MPNRFRTAGTEATMLANARCPNEFQAPHKTAIDVDADDAEAAEGLSADPAKSHQLDLLLTLRQRQIVAMLKRGSSNKEIAQVLGLAEGTVKVHLHSIYQRIGVSNRRQLAAKAFTK